MWRNSLLLIALFAVLASGCNTGKENSEEGTESIVPGADGSIMLNLDDAYLLFDNDNPDRNTAEWNFRVFNKGRYEVWLSSLTRDTMNLAYETPVIITFENDRIEGQPVGDEILDETGLSDTDYFRAESRLGSIMIRDTGSFNLQVISEKVLPGGARGGSSMAPTILDHIVLIPQSR